MVRKEDYDSTDDDTFKDEEIGYFIKTFKNFFRKITMLSLVNLEKKKEREERY